MNKKEMNILQESKDEFAKDLYGMTIAEAIFHGICISCREQAIPKCHSEDGVAEYGISGLCEECFDGIFTEGNYSTDYMEEE